MTNQMPLRSIEGINFPCFCLQHLVFRAMLFLNVEVPFKYHNQLMCLILLPYLVIVVSMLDMVFEISNL